MMGSCGVRCDHDVEEVKGGKGWANVPEKLHMEERKKEREKEREQRTRYTRVMHGAKRELWTITSTVNTREPKGIQVACLVHRVQRGP